MKQRTTARALLQLDPCGFPSRMSIQNHTSQDVEAVAALAESLADDDGLGEAFRRSDMTSIDGVWLRYSLQAQGLLTTLERSEWRLKRA